MLTWPVIKTISFLIVCVGIFLIYHQASSTKAQSPVATYEPEPVFTVQKDSDLMLPETTYVVFDIETGEVLKEKNSDDVRPIASITKLITASTLLKNDILKEEGIVVMSDVATDGRAGKLTAGHEYTYRELLFPLLLESSNDAAAVFMRATKGEVLTDMNTLASTLGMERTTLVDTSGLGDGNVSTASDLALFLTYLAKEEKHVLDMTVLTQYVGPHTGWVNNSPVHDSSYLGGKHGYTVAAGRTLAAIFEEEFTAGKRQLGYIILGSSDLAADTALLRSFVKNAVTFE